MSGLPQVTVIGTLTADVDLRFTPAGAAVANFTIASNSRRKNDRGEYEDGPATFLRCSLWRQAAEHAAESLTRGTRVIATGQLKQRDYTSREGDKRTVLELEIDEIGPSVRWATVQVQKATRGSERPAEVPPADDPWAAGDTANQAPF